MEVDIPGDPAFRLLAAVYASLGSDAVGLTVATTSSAEPFKFKVRSAHTVKRFDPEASPHDIDLLPGTRHLVSRGEAEDSCGRPPRVVCIQGIRRHIPLCPMPAAIQKGEKLFENMYEKRNTPCQPQ